MTIYNYLYFNSLRVDETQELNNLMDFQIINKKINEATSKTLFYLVKTIYPKDLECIDGNTDQETFKLINTYRRSLEMLED